MNENKRVAFCEDTKPPDGPMKIHTANKKKHTVDTKKHTVDTKKHTVDTKKHNSFDDEIKLIMSQTNVTREVAAKVYMECDEDLVNAIMYFIEQTSV